MTTSGDVGPRFPTAVWWLLGALLVVTVVAVVWGLAEYDDELDGPVAAARAGTDLTAEISGRDVTLSGTADAGTIDETINAVRAVRGVRRVDTVSGGTALVTPPTTTATEAPAPTTSTTAAPATTTTQAASTQDAPTLAALLSGGVVELTGTLPTQALATEVETAAADVYGTDNVVSELSVGNVASPGYVSSLPDLLRITEGLQPWNFTVTEDRLNVFAIGPDEDVVASKQVEFQSFADGVEGLEGSDLSIEIDPESVATSLTELLAEGANFETGSSRISTEAEGRLDSVVEILLANPSTVVTVEGHTDDQGNSSSNQELSEARAQAVVDYLVDGGVDTERLTAVGYGEDRPIADNTTSEGRAMNRRIEFVVNEGE